MLALTAVIAISVERSKGALGKNKGGTVRFVEFVVLSFESVEESSYCLNRSLAQDSFAWMITDSLCFASGHTYNRERGNEGKERFRHLTPNLSLAQHRRRNLAQRFDVGTIGRVVLDESAIKWSGGVAIHKHLISDANARKAL